MPKHVFGIQGSWKDLAVGLTIDGIPGFQYPINLRAEFIEGGFQKSGIASATLEKLVQLEIMGEIALSGAA